MASRAAAARSIAFATFVAGAFAVAASPGLARAADAPPADAPAADTLTPTPGADQIQFRRVGRRLFVGRPRGCAALRTPDGCPAVGYVGEGVSKRAHGVDHVEPRGPCIGVRMDTG